MKIEELLKIDRPLYADMESYMQSGRWQVVYDSPTALWMKWERGWLHAVAAFDVDEARRILDRLPPEDAVVLRGCEGLRELAVERGFDGSNPCFQAVYQAVYEKNRFLPISSELTIRRPAPKDYQTVYDTYDMAAEGELQEALAGDDFLGGYLGDTLVGYAGVHNDGSMGMLRVFEHYRRRGYSEALYAAIINNQLKKGLLPFAQILEDNEPSLNLHRKMGFSISEGLIFWMWH